MAFYFLLNPWPPPKEYLSHLALTGPGQMEFPSVLEDSKPPSLPPSAIAKFVCQFLFCLSLGPVLRCPKGHLGRLALTGLGQGKFLLELKDSKPPSLPPGTLLSSARFENQGGEGGERPLNCQFQVPPPQITSNNSVSPHVTSQITLFLVTVYVVLP